MEIDHLKTSVFQYQNMASEFKGQVDMIVVRVLISSTSLLPHSTERVLWPSKFKCPFSLIDPVIFFLSQFIIFYKKNPRPLGRLFNAQLSLIHNFLLT